MTAVCGFWVAFLCKADRLLHRNKGASLSEQIDNIESKIKKLAERSCGVLGAHATRLCFAMVCLRSPSICIHITSSASDNVMSVEFFAPKSKATITFKIEVAPWGRVCLNVFLQLGQPTVFDVTRSLHVTAKRVFLLPVLLAEASSLSIASKFPLRQRDIVSNLAMKVILLVALLGVFGLASGTSAISQCVFACSIHVPNSPLCD